MSTQAYFCYYDCPIGKIRLRASNSGLVALDHVNQQDSTDASWIEDSEHPVIKSAIAELDQYFQSGFSDFKTPLAPVGTDFQCEVWQALTTIPFGETRSYGDIAEQINRPKAVRAVGAANGRNPLSIFVPCHRVIGKNGKLTGYAGGLKVKEILINHEFSLVQ